MSKLPGEAVSSKSELPVPVALLCWVTSQERTDGRTECSAYDLSGGPHKLSPARRSRWRLFCFPFFPSAMLLAAT